jgi:hypothetical protein
VWDIGDYRGDINNCRTSDYAKLEVVENPILMETSPLKKVWLCTRLRQLEAKWFAQQFKVHGQGSGKGAGYTFRNGRASLGGSRAATITLAMIKVVLTIASTAAIHSADDRGDLEHPFTLSTLKGCPLHPDGR